MDQSKRPSYPDLKGKVAFVTGGSRGIGASTCRMLAENGVRVAVNGRDSAAIEGVVRSIRDAGGEALAAPADCTNAEALAGARDAVARELGDVDILVAFAGGGGEPTAFADLTEDKWRKVVDDNLTATFLTIKAFVAP